MDDELYGVIRILEMKISQAETNEMTFMTVSVDVLKLILNLLKQQEEQKRKWLQAIADTQLAVSPTGYESEEGMAKRLGEWNGLQMAWDIITGTQKKGKQKKGGDPE